MECEAGKIQHPSTQHRKCMHPQKKKTTKKSSLTARVLRLLRTNRDFEEPSGEQEEIVHVGIPASGYYNYQKEIETALLEAERKKAKALMEWQKRRFI